MPNFYDYLFYFPYKTALRCCSCQACVPSSANAGSILPNIERVSGADGEVGPRGIKGPVGAVIYINNLSLTTNKISS